MDFTGSYVGFPDDDLSSGSYTIVKQSLVTLLIWAKLGMYGLLQSLPPCRAQAKALRAGEPWTGCQASEKSRRQSAWDVIKLTTMCVHDCIAMHVIAIFHWHGFTKLPSSLALLRLVCIFGIYYIYCMSCIYHAVRGKYMLEYGPLYGCKCLLLQTVNVMPHIQ